MDRQAPLRGTMLAEKYRVERALGEGGMGVVLEATHVALAQKVAIKVLPRDPDHPEDACARLLREARIAAQLPGEHVARAIDFGETDEGDAFLVMERLVGRDLEHELEARGRLPAGEAVALVLQACEGVAEAHAVGLVHRDLKPANLFLTQRRDGSPLVKVLDFGIATWVLGHRDTGGGGRALGFGTPAYMAPEQFMAASAAHDVDARCDQYALAVVLYELVTGAPPFAASSLARLAMLVTKAPPPPLSERAPDAPRGLWPVLARALAKHPEDRYPDLSAFAAALSPFGGPSAERSRRGVATVLGAPPPDAFEAPPARAPSILLEPLGVGLGEGDSRDPDELAERAGRGRGWSKGVRRVGLAAAVVTALGGCAALGLSLDPTPPSVEAAARGLGRAAIDRAAEATRGADAEPAHVADATPEPHLVSPSAPEPRHVARRAEVARGEPEERSEASHRVATIAPPPAPAPVVAIPITPVAPRAVSDAPGRPVTTDAREASRGLAAKAPAGDSTGAAPIDGAIAGSTLDVARAREVFGARR